jgi:hypothetical protein
VVERVLGEGDVAAGGLQAEPLPHRRAGDSQPGRHPVILDEQVVEVPGIVPHRADGLPHRGDVVITGHGLAVEDDGVVSELGHTIELAGVGRLEVGEVDLAQIGATHRHSFRVRGPAMRRT